MLFQNTGKQKTSQLTFHSEHILRTKLDKEMATTAHKNIIPTVPMLISIRCKTSKLNVSK